MACVSRCDFYARGDAADLDSGLAGLDSWTRRRALDVQNHRMLAHPIHVDYGDGWMTDYTDHEGGEMAVVVTAPGGRSWVATKTTMEDAIALATRIKAEQSALADVPPLALPAPAPVLSDTDAPAAASPHPDTTRSDGQQTQAPAQAETSGQSPKPTCDAAGL